jgi:hypothetical protein
VPRLTYLIEAKPLYFGVPREGFEKMVKLFGSVSEAREIFAQDNDDVWTDALRVLDELELVEALAWSVARDKWNADQASTCDKWRRLRTRRRAS